jgi:hypothetical protein
LYLASKDLFCYSAAVTAEVEEEEFVCTNPGRPNPNSLLHNTRFLLLLEKAENEAADGGGWGIVVTIKKPWTKYIYKDIKP